MNRPEYVYVTTIPGRLGWVGCFYNLDNMKNECLSWATDKFTKDDLYFEDYDDVIYFKTKTPGMFDVICVIKKYFVEDAKE